MSVLRTDRLYPPGDNPGTHFCQRLSRLQDRSATGRNYKNPNDPIGNLTHHIPACRAEPQPTAPPCFLVFHYHEILLKTIKAETKINYMSESHIFLDLTTFNIKVNTINCGAHHYEISRSLFSVHFS